MHLPPFLLDQWLTAHEFATPAIRYNCASSTGPSWTLGEIMALGGETISLDDLRLSYLPPQGQRELRELIGRFYGVDPDWVVATTGASEALLCVYCATAEPGASITLPFPLFSAMTALANAWGFEIATYSLDRSRGFAHTADAVLAKVSNKTKLALVNTPHNPTGAVITRDETERLAAALAERGIPLVMDEVYHPLYFGAHTASAANVPNAIVVGDFSKAFSLPGLRIGWIIDRDAARRQRLIDMRSYFTNSGSPLTEAVAIHALNHIDPILERLTHVARSNLTVFEQFMQAHRDLFDWIPPSGGTVTFPWRLDGRDSRPMCKRLAAAGVLFAPGDCFGAAEHFRVGFGALANGFADAIEIASREIDS
jgi:aspartate/methionine/tyrosine aminotransferase